MNPTLDEIKNVWKIKAVGPNTILELRAIKNRVTKNKLFKRADYPSLDALKRAFEAEAEALNIASYNIYYVMNPIRDDFKKGSAKDTDIQYRDLLLIDIDKVGHKGKSSTDQEVEAARILSEQIADYLKSEGWGDPLRMMSGNGHHLYYTLDALPNNDEIKNLVEGVLNNLATKFNNNIVAVDTVVSNASRITKVPGTIARKGENTATRPHRMAVFL
jgi:hypothetical protein